MTDTHAQTTLPRYSYEQARGEIQASDAELRLGLKERRILVLDGPCHRPFDRWRSSLTSTRRLPSTDRARTSEHDPRTSSQLPHIAELVARRRAGGRPGVRSGGRARRPARRVAPGHVLVRPGRGGYVEDARRRGGCRNRARYPQTLQGTLSRRSCLLPS